MGMKLRKSPLPTLLSQDQPAFAYGADIVEPIDPFRVFNPAALGALGAAAVGLVFTASLFVYRPWRHFLCPFGGTARCRTASPVRPVSASARPAR